MAANFGGQPLLDPRSLRESCVRLGLDVSSWWGKPNSFANVLGCRPGRGWLLLSRASLDALGLEGSFDLTFSLDTAEVAGTKAPPQAVVHKNLHVVLATCLTPGYRTDPQAAYLVEVADRRHLYRTVPIDKAYNVRHNPRASVAVTDYYTATLSGATPWTWDGVAGDIWATIGSARLGTYPGLPLTPLGTPEGFDFYGRYAMDALEDLLDRIGCALALDTSTDTFHVFQLAEDDPEAENAFAANDNSRVWDSEFREPNRVRYPQYVRVLFPRQEVHPDYTGGTPWYKVDAADPDGTPDGVEAGTYVVLKDDRPAIYDSTGTIQNASSLASYAAERAADWFARARQDRLRRVYGLPLSDAGLRPGPQLKEGRHGDRGRGLVTEVRQYPGLDDGTGRGLAVFDERSPFGYQTPGGHWMLGGEPPAGGGGGGGSDWWAGLFWLPWFWHFVARTVVVFRTTGAPSGTTSPAYPWKEQKWDGSTWVELTGGRVGTTSNVPARELTGNDQLPTDTLDVGFLDPSGQFYVFRHEDEVVACWAYLDAYDSGTSGFTWHRVIYYSGSWHTATGTLARGGTYNAFEEAATPGIKLGTVVWLVYQTTIAGTEYWVFKHPGIWVADEIGVGSTVYSGIREVDYDHFAGLRLTGGASHSGENSVGVSIVAADRSNYGVVSTTAQSFGGLKKFFDAVWLVGSPGYNARCFADAGAATTGTDYAEVVANPSGLEIDAYVSSALAETFVIYTRGTPSTVYFGTNAGKQQYGIIIASTTGASGFVANGVKGTTGTATIAVGDVMVFNGGLLTSYTSASGGMSFTLPPGPGGEARRLLADPAAVPTAAVPPPPPLGLTPASPRAVVTVASGPEGKALLAISRPWLEAYAKRLGADFVVLDWEVPEHGIFSKFQLGRVLDHYERVVFIDADTVSDPFLAPDLFALTPDGCLGIYDDFPGLTGNGAIATFGEEYQVVRESQGMERKPLTWYGNTGVMVFDRSHREVFAVPSLPLPKLHCGEQHYWIARADDLGAKLHFLPREANYQWWENDRFGGDVPPDAIRHYSGMRPHRPNEDRLELMGRDLDLLACRAVKVVGVGAPRTGTTSLAQTLAGPLRSGHEPDVRRVQESLLGASRPADALRHVQRNAWLEATTSNLYGHCAGAAVATFPGARFVLTTREPTSWVRSVLSHRREPGALSALWREVDGRLRGGERGAVAWLAYWERHHRSVLDAVPKGRLFVLDVAGLGDPATLGRLAAFLGLPAGSLAPAHENRGEGLAAPELEGYDPGHLAALAGEVCPSWPEVKGLAGG